MLELQPSIDSLNKEKFDKITEKLMKKDMNKFIIHNVCYFCHSSLRTIYLLRKYFHFMYTYRPYINECFKIKHDINYIYHCIDTNHNIKCFCNFYHFVDPILKLSGKQFIKQQLYQYIQLFHHKCHKHCHCYKCSL